RNGGGASSEARNGPACARHGLLGFWRYNARPRRLATAGAGAKDCPSLAPGDAGRGGLAPPGANGMQSSWNDAGDRGRIRMRRRADSKDLATGAQQSAARLVVLLGG